MGTVRTENGIVIEYPKGCDNAPKKLFLIRMLAAVIDGDSEFLNEAFTAGVSLSGLPDHIEKIIMDSVITHGREGGFECTVYRKDKAQVEMGVFITFKSAGKNVITRVNVFKKESGK